MTSIFKHTNHEVYILTAQGLKEAGFAATWVLPASLLPGTPRFMVLATPDNETTKTILETKKFVIHLLEKSQASLLPEFGLESSKDKDKFHSINTKPSDFGPIIDGVVGYHLCELAATFDIGERLILIGDVKGGEVSMSKEPLRKNEAFAALSPKIVSALKEKHLKLGEIAKKTYREQL